MLFAVRHDNRYTVTEETDSMPMLRRFFRQMPWLALIAAAVLLGLAPFRPEPHLVEKLRLLTAGQLLRPLDVFDLLFHGAPLLLIAAKLLFGRSTPPRGDSLD